MPLWVRRDELSRAPEQVQLQAVSLSLTLASALAVQAHSLLGELVFVVALPLFSLATLQLAVAAPDTPAKLARHVGSMGLVRLLAGAAALLGALATLPPIWLFGRALIFPFVWSRVAWVFALAGLALSMGLRLGRRRLGSDTRALSSNVWPTLGLGVALSLAALSGFAFWLGWMSARELRAVMAAAAAALTLGHLWLVSTRRAKVAYAWARELLAFGLALVIATGLLVAMARRLELSWPTLLGAALCFVLLFELGKQAFRRLSRWLLAPQHGALLGAIEQIRSAVPAAPGYAELCAEVLRPLRRAAGSPEAAPLVYTLHPAGELRLDAAGFARQSSRPLPEVVRKRLERAPGLPLVRADLRQVLSRRPELRELIAALDELDALCVLPLMTDATLDGALVVAQGARRDPLSLEELDALEALTRFLAPLLAVLASVDRMGQRASAQERELGVATEKLRDAREELDAAQAELTLLRESATRLHTVREPVRYSPPMRALCAQLAEAAPQDVPLTLIAEAGTPRLELAAYAHRHSGRKQGPFVSADCAALGENALEQLCGRHGEGRRLGLLQLAQGGTLVLCDIAALALPAQRALASALAER
ncbi:MAG TPA: sigma 54-interacting transcriptional regulator, partial [Polyangiales bacterium]